MSSENYATAGFGSLILPTSLMRVDESVGKAKPIYDDNRENGDEGLLRPNAVESWAHEEKKIREDEEDAKDIIPVKIDGLQRRYSLDVEYGGTMLDVERDEDSWMNAVIVTGLSEEEKEKLDSSEENYETEALDMDNVEPYLEEHNEELEKAFEEGEVQIYIGDHKVSNRPRNQTYHDRIHRGMEFIGEIYSEELAEEMWQDFKQTTYETPIAGVQREEPENSGRIEVPKMVQEAWKNQSDRWHNTVEQNDRAKEAFGKLMEDNLLYE